MTNRKKVFELTSQRAIFTQFLETGRKKKINKPTGKSGNRHKQFTEK